MNHVDKVEENNAEGLYTPEAYRRAIIGAHHTDVMNTAHLAGRLFGQGLETTQGAAWVITNLSIECQVRGWNMREIADIAIAYGEGILSVKDEIVFGE